MSLKMVDLGEPCAPCFVPMWCCDVCDGGPLNDGQRLCGGHRCIYPHDPGLCDGPESCTWESHRDRAAK